MPGPAKRNDEDRVDPDLIDAIHVPRHQAFGGNRDPAQAPVVERISGGFRVAARLHFDECERSPALGDDVDLTTRYPRAACEDAPAMGSQIPAGDGLGATSALFG